MISKSDIKKIKSFILENADEKEARYIYSLFAKYENNTEFKQLFEEEFYEYLEKNNEEKGQNLIYLLDRIHQIIDKKQNNKKLFRTRKIFRWYSFTAALLLILLLIAEGIWFDRQEEKSISIVENQTINTLFASLDSRIRCNLPYGNEGSFLKTKKNNRKVKITNLI